MNVKMPKVLNAGTAMVVFPWVVIEVLILIVPFFQTMAMPKVPPAGKLNVVAPVVK